MPINHHGGKVMAVVADAEESGRSVIYMTLRKNQCPLEVIGGLVNGYVDSDETVSETNIPLHSVSDSGEIPSALREAQVLIDVSDNRKDIGHLLSAGNNNMAIVVKTAGMDASQLETIRKIAQKVAVIKVGGWPENALDAAFLAIECRRGPGLYDFRHSR